MGWSGSGLPIPQPVPNLTRVAIFKAISNVNLDKTTTKLAPDRSESGCLTLLTYLIVISFTHMAKCVVVEHPCPFRPCNR